MAVKPIPDGYNSLTPGMNLKDADKAMGYIDENIDVVLSDLQMGEVSGIELLQLWKKRAADTQFILITAVRIYRSILSPAKIFILGPMARCRFEPSCSEYALEALHMHGACRGSWLATKRLCRCHPWGSFGPDPVPPVANLPLPH